MMKKRNALLLTATLAAAAFVGTLNTPNADAQGRRNRGGQAGGGQGAGQGGGQNGAFGGAAGFGQGGGRGFGGFNAMQGAPRDPTRSAIPILLNRDEVKTEIMLAQTQSEEFAAGEKTAQDAVMQQMQDIRKNRPTPQSMQDLSQEEQQAKRTEARQKMMESRDAMMSTLTDSLEKKAETVLRPDQMTRLHQLDLQWRGPLALTDKKVGDKYNLTADQKTKLADLLKQSQTEQQSMMRDARTALRPPRQGRRGANGANGAATPAPTDPNAPATPTADPNAAAAPAAPVAFDPAVIQQKMTEAAAKADVIRLSYDAKALAVLTDAQKTQWTAAQGRKFAFRQLTPATN